MRDLGPDRLSEDGRYVLLRDPSGQESFRVPADRRLRALIDAASRSRERSSGQMEFTMESTLSPRDIQTRIRRGESVAEVAEAAGVSTEQIEGFAGPVLAEREYMVEQARKTPVRRKHVGGAGVMLGTIVGEQLAENGQSPDDAAWDAWRREDGRWTVVVSPRSSASASFLFDHKSRFVLPTDEPAHDLVGDVALVESSEMAIADALQSQDPLVPTVLSEDVDADVAVEDPQTPTARISSIKEARDRRAQEQQLSLQDMEEEPEDVEATDEPPGTDDELEHEIAEEQARIAVPDDSVAPRKKKAERRRVPSWDEIMFGGRDD
ncbi:septation protein SepH [Aeromicrobium sp. CTD01-1L150]|uniref:septation protein SepH n=1 Tax=Aeromicrobium sp. CTD01-1L150 TaxID=3341830 RepID=UPI0035C081F5